MATRPALTAEEVLESVQNDSDQDSDQEYTEPDLDFDVPMADGSDDEFSDLDEQEESVHVTRKLPVSSMEQQSLQGHSSASLSPRSDNYNPELVQTYIYTNAIGALSHVHVHTHTHMYAYKYTHTYTYKYAHTHTTHKYILTSMNSSALPAWTISICSALSLHLKTTETQTLRQKC